MIPIDSNKTQNQSLSGLLFFSSHFLEDLNPLFPHFWCRKSWVCRRKVMVLATGLRKWKDFLMPSFGHCQNIPFQRGNSFFSEFISPPGCTKLKGTCARLFLLVLCCRFLERNKQSETPNSVRFCFLELHGGSGSRTSFGRANRNGTAIALSQHSNYRAKILDLLFCTVTWLQLYSFY